MACPGAKCWPASTGLGAECGGGAAGYSGHHGSCWQSRRKLLAPVAPKGGDLVVLIVQTTLGGAPHGQVGACGHWGAPRACHTPTLCGHYGCHQQSGRCWLALVVVPCSHPMVPHALAAMGGVPWGQTPGCGGWGPRGQSGTPCLCGHHSWWSQHGGSWVALIVPKGCPPVVLCELTAMGGVPWSQMLGCVGPGGPGGKQCCRLVEQP